MPTRVVTSCADLPCCGVYASCDISDIYIPFHYEPNYIDYNAQPQVGVYHWPYKGEVLGGAYIRFTITYSNGSTWTSEQIPISGSVTLDGNGNQVFSGNCGVLQGNALEIQAGLTFDHDGYRYTANVFEVTVNRVPPFYGVQPGDDSPIFNAIAHSPSISRVAITN